MPQYMCLLYAEPGDEETEAWRMGQMPLWLEITESLRAAGVLVANAPLFGVETATTLRVRDAQLEITDGPFAATKETLVGYYVLECRNLDEAVRHARRLPVVEYGSIEIRPMMPAEQYERIAAEA